MNNRCVFLRAPEAGKHKLKEWPAWCLERTRSLGVSSCGRKSVNCPLTSSLDDTNATKGAPPS